MPAFRHRLTPSLVALLLAAPGAAHAYHDVLISEYVEGHVQDRALEFYNATPNPIDLFAGGYQVWIYTNGSVTPSFQIGLFGVIPGGGTHVLGHDTASPALYKLCDERSNGMSYNGNDAIALVRSGGSVILDVFGQIGFTPGMYWESGGVVTVDVVLRRKVAICDGDANGAAGPHRATWNGLDASGRRAPDGLYFLRFESADGVRWRGSCASAGEGTRCEAAGEAPTS